MNRRECEVCGADVVAVCSGLDVPELGFCEQHGRQHERGCKDIERGAARLTWLAKPRRAAQP